MKSKKENIQSSRRAFLRLCSVTSLGFLGLSRFTSFPAIAENKLESNSIGYGPLEVISNGILELPNGFSCKVISQKGTLMDDGFITPGKGDGMAAFAGKNGKVIIIRNHEISMGDSEEGPYGITDELLSKINKDKLYDYGKGVKPSMGGTTTLIYDENTQTVEKEFLSIAGTNRNCAGGVTPWNSWITCEENLDIEGSHDGYAEKNHGYNFEVPVSENIKLADPIPLIEMGRFNHEAVAVDPKTSIVYQTEDSSDGLIYRYIPNKKGKLAQGGKLQALAILDGKSVDTRNWETLESEKFPKGKQFNVRWIDIENVTSPDNDLRFQGYEKGAARFARGEGMWFGDNEFYFACTNGGHNFKGQVFRYIPSPYEGTSREKEKPGRLELFVEPNDMGLVKNCDNLTIAPWGDIVLCEDTFDSNLVGLTPKGEFYRIAKNIGFESELAGATFSPSGRTLFVNVQAPGITLAITGPWKNQKS